MDKGLDRLIEYWEGVVVNVADPKKQGRVQVRIFNLHDNVALIPDKDLPWAEPSVPPTHGASTRGVGVSPVGVIPGTVVYGIFVPDSAKRILIYQGSLNSAGRTKPGQTVDGSYAIDTNYGDVVNSARGQDLNSALGLKNLPALSQIGAVFPAVSAGLGALSSHTGNILSLMSELDPSNMSGSMAQSISGFTSSYVLNQLTDAAASFAGGVGGLLAALGSAQSLLSQGVAEAQALAALPETIRTLASSPAGISQLISMASSLSNVNPINLLSGSAVGGVVNQAFNLASSISGTFSTSLNQLIGNLANTSKLRQYAMQAASPQAPPIPDPPTTTSSTAVTTPSSSSSTNPYASVGSVELPPPVTSASFFEAAAQVTAAVPEVNYETENYNLMNELAGRNTRTDLGNTPLVSG